MQKAKNRRKAEGERGVCILCGMETSGVPAKQDLAIRMARRLRRAMKLPEKHTISCKGCFQECARRGEAFGKKRKSYLTYAILFFLLLIFGSAGMGGFTPWLILPGALGAAIIALLPYASYFPSFGK